MARTPRAVTTVLFTDIVGSTERAAELGDRGWYELLEEHHIRVRREIKRFGGREVTVAGDGFLAVFERPASAIRCGWAIREAVRQLGLEVRTGVHAGEVEGHGRDLGGITVHIGARVAAEAAPGEVLVTSTVRELVTGTGFQFEDRGARSLKGVREKWRLFALKGLPAGTAFRTGRWVPEISGRKALLGGALLLALAVLAAGVRLATRTSPGDAIASAAPGVAVVPFRVSDPALDIWREGVVDLLSTNLDGAGGLRAIDSRTLFARWRESVPEGTDPDLASTLDVALRSGASYAIVGSAISVGPDVRLTADVYDLGDRSALDQVQVEGPADSVLMLIDRLSIEILGAILPEAAAELPEAPSLASVTTASLPALKAYVEGEALYRRSDFRAAIGAYERAVEADSTFGLAYQRLSQAWGWIQPGPNVVENIDRALLNIDRLPPREASLVRANHAFVTGRNPYRALEVLRQAVQRYPDDPEAWYLMGDTYIHYGAQILADPELGGRSLSRAAQLDPAFAPFQIHLVEEAFMSGDRAAAEERMKAYGRAAAEDPLERASRLAFALAYGDSLSRVRAQGSLDTMPTDVLTIAAPLLFHPRSFADSETLFRTAVARLDATPVCASCLFWLLRKAGKLEAAETQLGDSLLRPWDRPAGLYHLWHDGLVIPPERLEAASRVDVADTNGWFYAGAIAADRGRWPDHGEAVRSLLDLSRVWQAEGDTVSGRIFSGAARALEGYGDWRHGRTQQALAALEPSSRDVVGWGSVANWNVTIRGWLGTLYLEAGRPEDAERYLESLWRDHYGSDTNAAYELARLYEHRGDAAAAIDAYDYVLTAWRNADPALAPRVEAARRSLSRLVGAED